MSSNVSEIANLKNLGPTSERWLNDIGIYTRRELVALGPVSAYQRLKAAGYNVSLNLVYAIQGAIMDLHWTDLPLALREELKQQIAEGEEQG
ncbi:MAG: TfoX/Sxy family protein, partial [Anaerolineae bacterium]|nr:TfoX/Sxy family protein [Anaerolineae bacterium]